ncbi:MAG: TraB/GumN family protein [Mediterranea sp.]|jgi:uncharacterized protein YbaP (TraB family)|nr:TraB/GumN family protein [Mediterranea sp.]
MNRFIPLALLCVVMSLTCCNQKATTSQGFGSLESNALLWSISGNGLKDTSYLLGSMHNVDRKFVWEIPGFKKAFFDSKQVAVEVDITSPEVDQNIPKKMASFLMSNDTTYQMLYDKEVFHLVDSLLGKRTKSYYKYTPAFWIKALLNEAQYTKKKSWDPMMDEGIMYLGYQNSKEVFFMEPVGEWSDVWSSLDSISQRHTLQQQARSLYEVIKKKDEIKAWYDSLKSEYRRTGLKYMLAIDSIEYYRNSKMTDREKQAYQAIMNKVGVERNEKWMPTILSHIHKASSFMAVGVRHLTGENGLIAKLRALGYKVEPVTE